MRKNSPSFRVYANPEQKALIQKAASESRLSVSEYCRTLALGHVPASKLDIEQVEKLQKVAADINRLGNLLKMLLTNDERLEDMGREMGVATIDGILVDIRFTTAKLKDLMDVVYANHVVRKDESETETAQ